MCGWFDAYSAGSCTLTVTAGGVTGSCTLTVNSAEAQPTAATYNLVNLGTSVSTSYTSSDGFMTIACSSNKGNHGLVMTNGNTVKIKVLAGAVIKFGNCTYNSGEYTVNVTNSSGTSLGSTTIPVGTNNGGTGTCSSTSDFTYSGTTTDTLTFTWSGTSGQTYLHSVQVVE